MATVQNRSFVNSYNPNGLCFIVGLACLAGFLVDVLTLSLPVDFGNIEWRMSLLRQLSDRSIILLFGLALMIYGTLDFRAWAKRLALLSLVLGVLFTLSSFLVIRDNIAFHKQALNAINVQAAQMQSQIQKAQEDAAIASNITPEQLSQATQQLTSRASELKSTTKIGLVKSGISSVGNLIIVGIALIGLGRYGARLS